jgi:glucose 1-dehydrogenase
MTPPLAGRRALVTGGATGIGRATCLRLAGEGAGVAVNYIGDRGPADEVVAQIGGPGPAYELVAQIGDRMADDEVLASTANRAIAVEADVSSEQAVAELFARAADGLGGPIDLLVNNAGVEAPYALEDMPLDEWQRVLSVNLTGPFLCSREMVRALPQGDGAACIVNVSSVHEVIPWPRFSHYCASKGGLKLFGQTIARELAPRGIRVAMVAPGAILTPINRQLVEDPAARREQEEQIPLGRLGEPEEIAGAIAWLAGPDARYVTGSTVFVDGGMTLYPRFV